MNESSFANECSLNRKKGRFAKFKHEAITDIGKISLYHPQWKGRINKKNSNTYRPSNIINSINPNVNNQLAIVVYVKW